MFQSKTDIKNEIESLIEDDIDRCERKLNNILSRLPKCFLNLIEEAYVYKRIPKEYLLSSILFTISSSIGLTFYIKALGYKNYGNCYFTIIGSRGDVKTEAIKIATEPIKLIDDEFYDTFKGECVQDNFDNESKRKQILLQNASIEAAQKVHHDNPNSVGIAIDEIFTLIEKMTNSNSRDGIAWRNFFLEGYTNGHIDISRKTTESFRIKETYPTLIGGLQHQFLDKLFSNGNLESGFIDRLFFTLKIKSNTKLTRGEISDNTKLNYNRAIKNILDYKIQSENPEEKIKQFQINLSKNAEEKIFIYTQNLIDRQNNAQPIIKEYMSKMQISIHKLCIIAFMLKHSYKSMFASNITEDVVDLAIDLNEFYLLNFIAIKEKHFNNDSNNLTLDQIIKLAKKNNAKQISVAEVTGVNKSTISRHWKKIN